MKSFLYIANVRMPTEKAHGLQIMKTCESLSKVGVNLTLLIPKRKNHIKEDPFNFYNVDNNFVIEKLSCIDFINLPFLKKLFFHIESFTFYLSVKKYMANKKYDVVYTRDLMLAYMLSGDNKNVFYEVHTLPTNPGRKYRQTWQNVRGIIVISDGIKRDLIEFGVPPEKIIVVRDGVDLGMFAADFNRDEARKRLSLDIDEKVVLYTGHLYEWKGADIFCQAAGSLPDYEFYLVGGTEADIKDFKGKYKFTNLHIVGWQPHEKIPYWQKSANVLVLPNSAKEKISSHYTSPIKLFEYMASGTPVVATRLPSLTEVLDDENAMLVEPDDEKSLCRGIGEVIENEEVYKIKAQRALVNVSQFGWSSRAEKIINFINIKQ